MKRVALIGSALFGLVVPTVALAGGGSAQDGYGGVAGNVQGTVQKSGTLPFTGLSLTIVLVVGLALVVAGLLMRRGGRSTT